MRFFQTTILFLLLIFTGCSESNEDIIQPDENEDGLGGLVIGVSQVASTRTAIDSSDNESVTWCVGDQIALWADGADGQTYISGEMFQLKYYGSAFNVAEFASSSTASMSSTQKYNYVGFYPHSKATISGKSVSYTIPSTQYGEYDGEYDYRIADSATGSALSLTADSDCKLSFRSLTHALKVTIPTGHNLLGEKVKTLTISFPDGVNIVGSVALSMGATSTAPVLSPTGASNVVTLDLSSNPIDEGDTVWLFINPVSNVTGDIKIRGFSVTDETSYYYDIPVSSMTFAAGYVTPVNAEIGEPMPRTTIELNITANNLGEEVDNIKLTAPSGGIFNESGTNSLTLTYTGVGKYSASYITEFYGDSFKGNSLSVQYDSEHALMTKTITLSSITDNAVNTIDDTVPYLLEEDFSGISSFNNGDNIAVGGTKTETGNDRTMTLSGTKVSGWTGDRIGGGAGKAVRITSRTEIAVWIPTYYDGRLDSPALTGLKSASNIKVSYKIKGGRYTLQFKLIGTASVGNGNGIYDRGSTTSTGALSGDDDGITISDNTNDSSITIPYTTSSYNSNTENYDSITTNASFEIPSATSSTRVSWRVRNTMDNDSFSNGNGNFWLYIDEIKVQIAN
ncbi:MAG: fimbrillin family protein [Rikenellaceae bacterium]